MSLTDRWAKTLADLEAQGRRRTLRPPSGIDFTSNDYLAYATRHESIATHHARSGAASRLLRGHHDLWDEVETALADWHNAEAALVVTSGYVANQGLLATIIEPGDWVASDQFNHASIIDGLRLAKAEKWIFRHNDLNYLEHGLRTSEKPGRQRFVVTESLFSMDGDVAPLTEMAELVHRYGAHLIVDEAHATGCFGTTGSGLVDHLGLRNQVLATVHTGGKALATVGAYICGSNPLKELLINRCRHFIFTTALPPEIARWWLDMLALVRTDNHGRRALHSATHLLRVRLREHGIKPIGDHYIVPILIGEDNETVRCADQLQQAGFDVRAVRPPTVFPGTARLRIAVHADHDTDTLHRLADILSGIVPKNKEIST